MYNPISTQSAPAPYPTQVPLALRCVVMARQASVDTGRIALTKKN